MNARPPCDCGAINGYWTTKVSLPGCSEYLCEDCLERRLELLEDWKIQTRGFAGWADIKTSDDGGEYYVLPMTLGQAMLEADCMVEDLGHRRGDYRIVQLSTPADCDLY